MKQSLAVTAVLLSLSFLGCGGPVSEPTMEPESVSESGESSTVSQFGTCTAQCSGGQTVSCSGSTCSQADYQGVTCNGVFTPCPPPPACAYISCSTIVGKRCFTEGESQPCCGDDGALSELYCVYSSNGRLIFSY